MRFIERLVGNQRQETLDPNLLQTVADKLLEGLKSGFIKEFYEGDPDEESLRHSEGYTVVLKAGNKFYMAHNHSNRRYPRLSGLGVYEFRNLDEMRDFINVQRFALFHSSGTFSAHRGHRWKQGYSRLDLNLAETRDFLRKVKKVKVDIDATQWLFEHETEFAQSRGWKHRVYRWPRLAKQP